MHHSIERQSVSQTFHSIFEIANASENIFIPSEFVDGSNITHRYRIPIHQRRYQWSKNQEKLFIHSLLQNYPIHSIICISRVDVSSTNPYVFYDIEDGQSRLTCCWKFVNGLFTIKIGNDNEVNYSNLSPELRQRLSNYTLTFEIISFAQGTTRTQELQICSDIFTRINNGKPLSCNDKFHANAHQPCMTLLKDMTSDNTFKDLFVKFCGDVGNGKSRTLLSDLCGAVLTIAHHNEIHLTTSFSENYEILHKPIDQLSKSNVIRFFRSYFDTISKYITNVKKVYGKLSGTLGYYCYLFVNRDEYASKPYEEALIWYLQKRNINHKYTPKTFWMLSDGEKRNCRPINIKKRVDAIIQAFIERNNADESDNGESSSSDTE
jgi:hypothetical protein